jgi:hypothetical protein
VVIFAAAEFDANIVDDRTKTKYRNGYFRGGGVLVFIQ